MTLWEILKANKTGIAPDMFTMLAASKMNGGRDRLHELSGIPPLSFTAKGKPLTAWSITGNTVQNGTPTPENPVEVQAVGDRTGNLFDYKKYFKSTFTEYGEFFEWAEIQLKPFTTYTFATSFGDVLISGTTVPETSFIITTSAEKPKTLTGGISSNRMGTKTKTTEQDGIIKIYKRIKGRNLPKKEDFDSGMHWLMINEGDTALSYEPYGYKIPFITSAEDGSESITTPIYLPTPLYSGEVLRSDGSREVKWGKIVLTGEEKILFAGTAGTSYRYDFTNIKTISQIKYARKNSKITHFEQCNMPTIDVVGYDWHGGSFHLMIITTQSTINKFKDWLKSQYEAGTPVTVWYQLATPTTETVTVPQIPTLNGTTVIDVDTAVKPESMTVKYRR